MKNILLVEDDEALIKLYTKKLENEGFVVDSAPTGVETLEKLNKNIYDLILLDIMLPEGGMNGFDILEYVAKDEKLKKIPVIVFTNLDSEEKSAMEIGAKAYMIKSNTTPEQLVEKIRELI